MRWIVGAAAVMWLGAGAARAGDEVTTVNITSGGPDHELPVGKSFNLAGTAVETVQSVQALIVRKGNPVVGGSSGPSCSNRRIQLGQFNTKVAAKTKPPADVDASYSVLDAGIRQTREVWEWGDAEPVLVTEAWKRGTTTGAQQFKIFVPSSTEFFLNGFSFCLYLMTVDKQHVSVEAKAKDAFDTHMTAMAACPERSDAAARALEAFGVDLQQSAPQLLKDCQQTAINTLRKALDDLGVPGAAEVFKAAENYRTQPEAIRYLLQRLSPASIVSHFFSPTDLDFFISLDPPNPNYVQNSHLALYVAQLLTGSRSGLARHASTFSSDGGEIEVHYLGFRDGGLIDVSVDGTASKKRPVATKLDDLKLDDITSAADVVAFTQGRFFLAAKQPARSMEALSELESDLKKPLGTDNLTTLKLVADRAKSIAAIHAAGLRASKGYVVATHDYPAGAPAFIPEQRLGEWLREIIQSCASTLGDAPDGLVKECKGDASSGGYTDGYFPADLLASATASLLAAHTTWIAARANKFSVDRTATSETRIDAKIAYTRDTWALSFLTPAFGYAHIPFAQDSLFFAGIQAHLYPNPVDDPQWSHGAADIGRAFALELGFAPTTTAFGPDKRLDGPWSLPPLFIGLAFHPIPFTSISAGVALADLRTTTLAQEEHHVDKFGYIAVSLQGNLPDLLRQKLGYDLKTTVSH